MDLEQVNERIRSEICHGTIAEISDEALQDAYYDSPAFKRQSQLLWERMRRHDIAEDQISRLLSDPVVISNFLVSPGSKGNLRGIMFNQIIARHIREMNLDTNRFDIRFEQHSSEGNNKTSEIPDWTIQDRHTQRQIIGMNQVALWGGGQQTNRASKYLADPRYNTADCKLLCVVCYDVNFTSTRSKVYRLVKQGLEHDTLCYVKKMPTIIRAFFQLL